jgi:eukaryotic-like serine/threonine-protein kinase
LELAQASYWSGLIHYNRNDFSAAMTDWSAYLNHARRLRALAPSQSKWIMEESYALNNLGVIAFRSGDLEKAIPLFALDIALKRKAIAISPDNAAYQQEFADSRSWMTSALEANGRISEAASAYDEQIKSLRRLVSRKEQYEKWKFRLANLLQLKAIVEMQTGRIDIANENATESISILKSLTQENPDRIDWKKVLARALVIRAEIMEEKRDIAESIAMLREATTQIDDANHAGPLDPTWERLAIHARFLSAIHAHSDTAAAATGIANMQALLDRAFSNEIAVDHAKMLILLGRIHASHGDREKARDVWTSAVSTLNRVKSRRRADWNRLWVESHWLLGRHHEVRGNAQWLNTMDYRAPSYVALIAAESSKQMP